MSMEGAMERIRKKYEIYKQKLKRYDPSVQDQLIDSRMQGKVEAYEEIMEIFQEKEDDEDKI